MQENGMRTSGKPPKLKLHNNLHPSTPSLDQHRWCDIKSTDFNQTLTPRIVREYLKKSSHNQGRRQQSRPHLLKRLHSVTKQRPTQYWKESLSPNAALPVVDHGFPAKCKTRLTYLLENGNLRRHSDTQRGSLTVATISVFPCQKIINWKIEQMLSHKIIELSTLKSDSHLTKKTEKPVLRDYQNLKMMALEVHLISCIGLQLRRCNHLLQNIDDHLKHLPQHGLRLSTNKYRLAMQEAE
ncbi:hypothetical protein FQR65_LT03895 [Abscondita terminalis]|nr:hypothetical protein FQR65_LT03895 [Abscondita terminalis]